MTESELATGMDGTLPRYSRYRSEDGRVVTRDQLLNMAWENNERFVAGPHESVYLDGILYAPVRE